ncbi:MAG TPA: hypothetical protein VK672_01475 [Solirubrobacteraceae bacterium]|nr:hypothetical protein [Solirubrobacteraceae bacterium]
MCALAAAALERCYGRDYRLMGERELRRDERESGRSLLGARLGSLSGKGRQQHCPDLVLWPHVGDGLPVAVEMELTVKGSRRLVEICRAWARCRAVAGVIYIAPEDVARALGRAIDEARAWEQVVVLRPNALPGMEGLEDKGVL